MAEPLIPLELDTLLAPLPDLRDGFARFLAATFDADAVPPATLERCRRRVAALHGADPADCGPAFAALPPGEAEALARGEIPSGLPAPDAVALAIADCIPWRHHDLTDEPVLALRAELGDRGAVTLMAAIAMFDALCRMATVARNLHGA